MKSENCIKIYVCSSGRVLQNVTVCTAPVCTLSKLMFILLIQTNPTNMKYCLFEVVHMYPAAAHFEGYNDLLVS